LREARGESDPDKAATSVILCDVDHLGAVNAVHGREAGDSLVLQLFVDVCQLVPVEDILWESERADLVIIARRTSSAAAYDLAEKIRNKVAQKLYWVAQKSIMVTVSMGYSTEGPDYRRGAGALLKTAEDRLEVSKSQGPSGLFPVIN
jgi:diguanylate cyclase (GGDEF)-like protein